MYISVFREKKKNVICRNAVRVREQHPGQGTSPSQRTQGQLRVSVHPMCMFLSVVESESC